MSEDLTKVVTVTNMSDHYDLVISSFMAIMPPESRLTSLEFWVLRELLLLYCKGTSMKGIRRIHGMLNRYVSYESLRIVKIALTTKGYLVKARGEFIIQEALRGCGKEVIIQLQCDSCGKES